MKALDTLRGRLQGAQVDTFRVHKLDKDKASGAFDSGRYEGLKQANEILNGLIDTEAKL
jgi:hypothetical protein